MLKINKCLQIPKADNYRVLVVWYVVVRCDPASPSSADFRARATVSNPATWPRVRSAGRGRWAAPAPPSAPPRWDESCSSRWSYARRWWAYPSTGCLSTPPAPTTRPPGGRARSSRTDTTPRWFSTSQSRWARCQRSMVSRWNGKIHWLNTQVYSSRTQDCIQVVTRL